MVISLKREIVYPDSDGQPMADNTKQFLPVKFSLITSDTISKALSYRFTG